MSKLCKMGIAQDGGTKFFAAGWSIEAKPCDYCKSSAALLFCRADSAFMCLSCDARIHDQLMCSDHPRVWMCEVCEHAPAAFTCKADAATLCVACDRDIHAANPLARRHERVAVVPFYDTAESLVLKSAAATLLEPIYDTTTNTANTRLAHEGVFPDSWISPNPTKIEADTQNVKSFDFLLSDSDPFLEFNDSVVPVQTFYQTHGVPTQLINDPSTENRFEIDFSRSNISYTAPSLSHSMSSSSMDVGVVPDGTTMSDTSYLNGNQSSQVVGMDREARVLRYREKRKNRKFEKTIRYASRKAYAETRPRVKGRFAKRNDADSDINRIFGAEFVAGGGYGVVPSF